MNYAQALEVTKRFFKGLQPHGPLPVTDELLWDPQVLTLLKVLLAKAAGPDGNPVLMVRKAIKPDMDPVKLFYAVVFLVLASDLSKFQGQIFDYEFTILAGDETVTTRFTVCGGVIQALPLCSAAAN